MLNVNHRTFYRMKNVSRRNGLYSMPGYILFPEVAMKKLCRLPLLKGGGETLSLGVSVEVKTCR